MTTEDDFQAALDADPGDHFTRLVFADWLDDRGDPRGSGYRAMGEMGRFPASHRFFKGQWDWFLLPEKATNSSPWQIPEVWLINADYSNHEGVMWCYPTRWRAEDALARGWGQLEVFQQEEVIATLSRLTHDPAGS